MIGGLFPMFFSPEQACLAEELGELQLFSYTKSHHINA